MVVPVIDAAIPSGCCGIQGEHWRQITDAATRDAAQHAVELLEALGCPPANVTIEVGDSVPEIAQRTAARYACDVVAVSRKRWPWSTGGMSGRQFDKLRRAVSGDVLGLVAR